MDFSLLKTVDNEEQQPRSIKGSEIRARNKISLNNTLLITTLDDLVPANHLVRKLNQVVNWPYIHTLYDSLYSVNGAPRVDPIILFKIMILNIINGYQSIRSYVKLYIIEEHVKK